MKLYVYLFLLKEITYFFYEVDEEERTSLFDEKGARNEYTS